MNENYAKYHGKTYKASIKGNPVEGHISVNPCGVIYLCQNVIRGSLANDLLGYEYSWTIGSDIDSIHVYDVANLVIDFKITGKKKLPNTTNWKTGANVVNKDGMVAKIKDRYDNFVQLSFEDGTTYKYTKIITLKKQGWRIKE